MDTGILLSSTVIGGFLSGLIAGFIALRTGERKIEIENITQERAKWRTRIQELSLAVHQASCSGNTGRLGELVTEFSLNLNPFDDEDKAIPNVIYKLAQIQERQGREELLLEFRERIALLLKHDWDRAKYEALHWFNRSVLSSGTGSPRRISYSQYKTGESGSSKRTPLRRDRLSIGLNFFGVMIPSGLLYYIAVILKEPLGKFIPKYDKSFFSLSLSEHIEFIGASLIIGSIWTSFYLWFKGSERKFFETRDKK